VADILIAYLKDVVPGMKSRSGKYAVSNLAKFWSDKTLAEVTKANCKTYAQTRPQSAARADLERSTIGIKTTARWRRCRWWCCRRSPRRVSAG
jgi:hypothetical protein